MVMLIIVCGVCIDDSVGFVMLMIVVVFLGMLVLGGSIRIVVFVVDCVLLIVLMVMFSLELGI